MSIIPIPRFTKAAPVTKTTAKPPKPEVSEAMRRFKLFRWGFFAVVAVTMGLYLRIGNFQQQIAITVQSDENFKQALLEAQRHRLEAQATRKQGAAEAEEGDTSADEDDGGLGEDDDEDEQDASKNGKEGKTGSATPEKAPDAADLLAEEMDKLDVKK